MSKPFHLAWFTNLTQGDWLNPMSQGAGNRAVVRLFGGGAAPAGSRRPTLGTDSCSQ
jgi:hypothetical protein